MKVNKSELIESIRKLNKQKPLKEAAEIQRATLPADADALEQHQQALKQNAERRDPKNYAKEVKEVIEETASEESRYRHFDVVDRKDLAKRINEAKEKGLDFKVSRSNKAGFRYDLKVLKEEFLKKEAGDPEVNTAAFNKATNVGASSPNTGLGEGCKENLKETIEDDELYDFKPLKRERPRVSGARLAYDLVNWISEYDDTVLYDVVDYLVSQDYDKSVINGLFFRGDTLIEGMDKCSEEGKNPSECEDDLDEKCEEIDEDCKKPLGEELKVFTSDLANFHPSQRAEELWQEIQDANKIEDLEYALETLYPDGISDVALDDMLIHEDDWIRDLIGLTPVDSDIEKEQEDKVEIIDDFDDEDVEPVDYEESEEKQEKSLKKDVESEIVEPTEDEDQVGDIAEGFLKTNFKPNTLTEEKTTEEVVKQAVSESGEDEEVVAVDDELVENMLGLPKSEKSKKD